MDIDQQATYSEPIWMDQNSPKTREYVFDLLKRINALCATRGWSEGYFGKIAGGDTTVVRRLRENGRITIRNVERLETFLAAAEAAG